MFNHPAFNLGGLSPQSLTFAQQTGAGNGMITEARRIEIRANLEF